MLVFGWVRGAGAVWRSARLVHLLSVVCWGEQEQASIKQLWQKRVEGLTQPLDSIALQQGETLPDPTSH